MSRRRGLRIILLEDVHWADDASLDLLAFLAAELSQVPGLRRGHRIAEAPFVGGLEQDPLETRAVRADRALRIEAE